MEESRKYLGFGLKCSAPRGYEESDWSVEVKFRLNALKMDDSGQPRADLAESRMYRKDKFQREENISGEHKFMEIDVSLPKLILPKIVNLA